MGDYDTGETEFNSNIATLERIDTLLKNCGNAHFDEDVQSYFKHIRNLRKEILVKIKDKEKYKGEFETEKKLYGDLVDAFAKPIIEEQLLVDLEEYENFLRYSCDQRGMLLKNRDMEMGL